MSKDVFGVTGFVLDFQTLQIQQLAVVDDLPDSKFAAETSELVIIQTKKTLN